MWNYMDKKLAEYQKEANKVNKKTMDEFQNVFDRAGELDEDASENDLKRFKNRINNSMIYLSAYGQFQARKYLNRCRIPYRDILWFDIFLIYAYQQYTLLKLQEKLFSDVVNNAYEKEIKELEKYIKPKQLNVEEALKKALESPNSRGYIWQDYLDASTEYKATEMYNKAVQVIRSNKPLDIYNPEFQKLLAIQNKRMLNINGNKTSGALDNELVYLVNEMKTQTYIFNGVEKCRFIAIHDSKTTEMCISLDNQIFNVHDWNEFVRYSASAEGEQRYKVYGLVPGVNLPPIDDHFHYCRSTITYQLDYETEDYVRNKLTQKAEENTQKQEEEKNKKIESTIYKVANKEDYNKMQEYGNKVYNNLTRDERKALHSYTKQEFREINEELLERNGNIKGAFYEEEIKNLDSAINKSEVPENIIAYKLTNYDYYSRYAKGEEFKLDIYNSTTIKENETELFEGKTWQSKYNYCELQIKVPKGTKGLYIGENTGVSINEYELLLQRGLTYRNNGIIKEGKIPVIELEVLK